MFSNLPREAEFTEKLALHEVIQCLMVATASSTAFVAEMARQYSDVLEKQDSGKLEDKISKLEKQLAVAESEKTHLQEQLDQAAAKEEESEATINSLRSALEEEQKMGEEKKKSHQQALEGTGASAVEVFRRSETFTKDLGELTLPRFMFGYISTIDEIASHLSSEDLESFKNNANYNEDSKELSDWMAEGIQSGKDLVEIRDEFNRWLSELDQELEREESAKE